MGVLALQSSVYIQVIRNIMKIPVYQIDLNKIINDLNEINLRCNELKSKSTFPENDVRNMIFTLFSIEIQFILLSVTLSKNLTDINFYKDNGYNIENIDEESLGNSIYQHTSSLSNSFFILIFVQLENYLRLIASHKNINHFKISKTITNISEKYGITEESLKLLKILLNLRNSMHDGGFFNHIDDTIIYKGQNFEFLKGKPILMGGIPFNIYLSFEILENIITQVNENTKAEEFIEHNYANLKFEIEE